jgi:hypothetical protein
MKQHHKGWCDMSKLYRVPWEVLPVHNFLSNHLRAPGKIAGLLPSIRMFLGCGKSGIVATKIPSTLQVTRAETA